MEDIAALFREAAKTQGITEGDFTQPVDHHILANNIRMHYVDWGGNGVPILFLHGGGQTCRTWDMAIVQIRSKYHCIALDQRNHGDTEKTPDYSQGASFMAEDVRGAVQALGLKSFVLVGMSMGGINTMTYASKYPKELRAVGIVDITPTIKPHGSDAIQAFSAPIEWSSLDDAVAAAVKFNPLRPASHLRYSLMHSLRQRADGKWVWKHQRAAAGAPQPAEGNRGNLWEEVGKIPCPTLVFHGEKSNVTDRALCEKLAKTLPKGEVVTIMGAGHTVQGDQPKTFVAELTRFLAKHGM